DKMPQVLWHNVRMAASASAQIVAVPARAESAALAETNPAEAKLASFQPDWREVERGLPISKLEEFSACSGIALKDLLEVVIPARTLKHRRQRNEPLSLEESDRLARVARMYELAVKVYGDREDGREWLLGKKKRFDDRTALSMLRSEA